MEDPWAFMKSKGEIKFTQNIIYNFISSIKCDSFFFGMKSQFLQVDLIW